MKRYVRASYDSSMPSWLKSDAGKAALDNLNRRYAMSQATFSKSETPDSVPIYLLDDTYKEETSWGETYKTPAGQYVFVPDFSTYNRFISVGKTFRTLSTASKARIQEHVIDTVYMTAPLRETIREDRGYVDPRYSKDWGSLVYRGQTPYYGEVRNAETGEWERSKVPTRWNTYSRFDEKRDKSGYVIPNPTELYKRLYSRFPERLKGRVQEVRDILDEYYDKVDAAKTLVFSQYDIRKGKGISIYDKYKNDLYYLNEAIENYGYLYSGFEDCMDDDGSIDSQKLATFINSSNWGSIPRLTADIDNYVNKINSALKK